MGQPISLQDAITYRDDFQTNVLNPIPYGVGTLIPEAVVFKIDELRTFLNEAETSLTADGVNHDNQGIAIYLGLCSNTGRTNLDGKVTTVLIATDFDVDAATGRVTRINNPVHDSNSTIHPTIYDMGERYP